LVCTRSGDVVVGVAAGDIDDVASIAARSAAYVVR
jgi:hypothetical protein